MKILIKAYGIFKIIFLPLSLIIDKLANIKANSIKLMFLNTNFPCTLERRKKMYAGTTSY